MKHAKWLSAAVMTLHLLAALCPASGDPAINPGDSRDLVVERLGEPGGHLRIGTHEILIYDRGKIELMDGTVTSVALVSSAEAARMSVERARQRAEKLAHEKARRARLKADGQRIMAEKLADPFFLALPALDRVSYWTSFKVLYPDVDVSIPYDSALAEHKGQRRERDMARRLAELEERTEAAERRARSAERRAAANYYPRVTYNYPYTTGYNVIHCPSQSTRLPLHRRPAVHRHPNAVFVIDTSPTRHGSHIGISSSFNCLCRVPCGRAHCRNRLTISSHGIGARFSSNGLNAGLYLPW